MVKYKLKYAELINRVVELPDNAIPLQVGLMMTDDNRLADSIKYLVKEDKDGVRPRPRPK